MEEAGGEVKEKAGPEEKAGAIAAAGYAAIAAESVTNPSRRQLLVKVPGDGVQSKWANVS